MSLAKQKEIYTQKYLCWDFPQWSNGSNFLLQMQGLWVPFLIRELRYHMPQGMAKKKRNKKAFVLRSAWHTEQVPNGNGVLIRWGTGQSRGGMTCLPKVMALSFFKESKNLVSFFWHRVTPLRHQSSFFYSGGKRTVCIVGRGSRGETSFSVGLEYFGWRRQDRTKLEGGRTGRLSFLP